jgi:hypothetical protein
MKDFIKGMDSEKKSTGFREPRSSRSSSLIETNARNLDRKIGIKKKSTKTILEESSQLSLVGQVQDKAPVELEKVESIKAPIHTPTKNAIQKGTVNFIQQGFSTPGGQSLNQSSAMKSMLMSSRVEERKKSDEKNRAFAQAKMQQYLSPTNKV